MKKIQLKKKKSFEKGDFRGSLLRDVQIYLLTHTDFKISPGVSMFLVNVFYMFVNFKIKYKTYFKVDNIENQKAI